MWSYRLSGMQGEFGHYHLFENIATRDSILILITHSAGTDKDAVTEFQLVGNSFLKYRLNLPENYLMEINNNWELGCGPNQLCQDDEVMRGEANLLKGYFADHKDFVVAVN